MIEYNKQRIDQQPLIGVLPGLVVVQISLWDFSAQFLPGSFTEVLPLIQMPLYVKIFIAIFRGHIHHNPLKSDISLCPSFQSGGYFCLLCNKKIIMSKNVPSAPSIQACLEQLQRKEQREQVSKQQYLSNLKNQCQIRENALKTAQSLIMAYQRENDTLKLQKQELQEEISLLDGKVAALEAQISTVKNLERTVLKYSQKINELLEKNMGNQQKIHFLEKELQRVTETQLASEAERARAKLKAKEQKQRKDIEGQFKNYLRLPHGEESSFAASVGGGRDQGDRKVLQWKLKQKDEEVMILLKRLRDMEEKLDVVGRKGRHMTFDSNDGASTKQSKKMNVSQFQH